MISTVVASVLCFTIPLILFRLRPTNTRLVKLDDFWERILWSIRIHRFQPNFPRTLQEWTIFVEDRQFQRGWDAWSFLRPFFASRGYTLYDLHGDLLMTLPHPEPVLGPATGRTYPYARIIADACPSDTEDTYNLYLKNALVWAARDVQGRDVIIKLISEVDKPTDEWRALQRLNDTQLRSDPANWTIHVIEFIKFDNFVFVVMPRWDCAFDPPFTSVSELMDVAKSYLEALNFLHKQHIVHMDIRMHNCGMNMYASREARYGTTSMRKAEDVRYILYDFGYSLMYPSDIDISTVILDRLLAYQHALSPTGPYNPFKADVSMMGGLLFGFVMHAAQVVPKVEPFFYRMMDMDENKRISASQALDEFQQIVSDLSPEQLQTPVNALWSNKFRSKLLPSRREMKLWRDAYVEQRRLDVDSYDFIKPRQ